MILYTSIFQYFTGDLILIKSSFLFSLRNGLKTITNRLVILARLNLASCLKIEAELPHGKIVTDPEHAYNLSFPPTFDVRKMDPWYSYIYFLFYTSTEQLMIRNISKETDKV